MEQELIKRIGRFLSGYGSGYGNGDGDGYGYGNGDGDGYGYGNGDGDGYGYGYGDGDGSGYGNGNGYGDGDGSGYGNGDGDGYGYGDGNGNGDGNGVKLLTLSGKVYYIDNIPCRILNINNACNLAEVEVIDLNFFTTKKMYVAKFGNSFAHAETVKVAFQEAENKHYISLDQDQVLEEFKSNFKEGVKYSANLFYQWHTRLTGSCSSGKEMFVKQKQIDIDNDKFTINEFLEIVEGAYGWNILKQLKQ